MAIIYSYPQGSSALQDDMLVITRVDKEENKITTKQLTLGQVADYIIEVSPVVTGTGTPNYIPMWGSGGGSIVDSIISTAGSSLIINGSQVNEKVLIGWDTNEGSASGFGYMYNSGGSGLRFGSPTNLILEVNSSTPKIVSWEDHFFKKGIKDKDGSVGMDDQVLISKNSKVKWIDSIFGTNSTFLRSTVRLNSNNTVNAEDATVSGGAGNKARGISSTISGGNNNISDGPYSTIAGGRNHIIGSSSNSTISGGKENTATGGASVVAGGLENVADKDYSIVGGGQRNEARGQHGVISGGRDNIIGDASFSSISGGKNNNTSTFGNAHIIGSNITADRVDTTFVENLSIKSIPTSSAGLPSGSIWSNNGVLNIVP